MYILYNVSCLITATRYLPAIVTNCKATYNMVAADRINATRQLTIGIELEA